MSLWLWLTVIAAGAVGQFVDAIAGMGFGALSGSIMLAGGVAPSLAVGTVNLAKVGSGLVSGISHHRFGNIQWAWVLPLAVAGVMGGVMGALFLTRLPEEVIRLWVPIILLVMGILIVRRFIFAPLVPPVAGGSQEWAPAIPQRPWQSLRYSVAKLPTGFWLSSIGFAGGILNGMSGAWGPFATSSVLLVKGGHPRFAVGTVNLVEFFVAAAVSATIFSQVALKGFQWQLPLLLMVGSVITAPLGAYLTRRVSAKFLGIVVGLALISVNIWSIARVLS